MIKILGYDLTKLVLSIIYIIIGIIIFDFFKKIIIKATSKNKILKKEQAQKIKTMRSLIINIIKYTIVIIVALAILSNFGINVKSILAVLGIGTALIGLAFQDLAKDLIAGFSIITEEEYEVGDTIEIDGFMGEVIAVGLRTTRIRNYKGATKIIANHYMDNIINYSNSNSLAIIDVGIAYENNEKEIEETFNKLFERLKGKIPNAIKEPELWGVNELADSSVIYRVAIEVKPTTNFETERFMRKEIKKEFDEAGIKIPYQQIEVHNGK